jgi:hypothetical protein
MRSTRGRLPLNYARPGTCSGKLKTSGIVCLRVCVCECVCECVCVCVCVCVCESVYIIDTVKLRKAWDMQRKAE